MAAERDPLALPADEMRRAGYATVDALVALLAGPSPILHRATPAEMDSLLAGPVPEQAQGYDEVLADVVRDVLPYASRGDHPGYFAYIPSCGTWPAALADLMASAMNIYCGSWMESAGATAVELQVLDWFRRWIGYPEGADGVLVSGGSAANLTAMACARELRLGAMSDRVVAYCSDQAHSSVTRAARTLGFRPDQLRVVPTDTHFRMRVDALTSVMRADAEDGRVPLFVSASAGSTNTGAVDSLPELAALCQERDVWLHVDAAYGGFAMMTERGREWLAGIEEADSVTLDPHKWLYQPFECGALLVRDRGTLEHAFAVSPDYLADTTAGPGEVNFSDRGLQLTRGSRALKVWMSLRTFGLAAFRDTVDRSLDLARLAQRIIEEDPRLELMTPATLGVVCFRRRFEDVSSEAELGRLNAAVAEQLVAQGIGLVSSTRLHGRFALRMCVLNHTSGERDVRSVLEHLASAEPFAASLSSVWRPHGADRLPCLLYTSPSPRDLSTSRMPSSA